MDMDMDIDIDLGDLGDMVVPEQAPQPALGAVAQGVPIQSSHEPTATDSTTLEGEDTVPHKINVQGVDELSTADLAAYAVEQFPDHKPTIEWINDTSVNFVFEDADVAAQALTALTGPDAVETDSRKQREARPIVAHPASRLAIRIAVASDKKQPRAREASRYYLLHPEEEEKSRRRPQRRRRRSEDEVEKFDASMYDDDESALASRRDNRDPQSRDRRRTRDSRSASPGRSRSPRVRGGYGRGQEQPRRRRNSGKELFADPNLKAANNKAAASNLKKELFPLRAGVGADNTADLFSSKMSVPLVDGPADTEDFPLRSDAMYQKQKKQEQQGFSIKGSASTTESSQGFSIRGVAGQRKTFKELFPEKANGTNAGKELFGGGGRAPRRHKAADLFG